MTSASLFDKPVEGFAELGILHSLVYLLDKFFCGFLVHFHISHNAFLQNRLFSKSAAFWNSRNPKDFGISEKLRFSEDLGETSLLPRHNSHANNLKLLHSARCGTAALNVTG